MTKSIFVKKIIFGLISLILIIDVIFLPFVTEPFVFVNGINEEYIFGAIIIFIVWTCFIFLNHVNLEKMSILSFEKTILFAKAYPEKSKKQYYYQLDFFLKAVTLILMALILFGLFSILDQYNLILKNFHIFFN